MSNTWKCWQRSLFVKLLADVRGLKLLTEVLGFKILAEILRFNLLTEVLGFQASDRGIHVPSYWQRS